MALTPSVLEVFAGLDTDKQFDALKRAGFDTEAADVTLGYMRGMFPDKADALMAKLDTYDKYGVVA